MIKRLVRMLYLFLGLIALGIVVFYFNQERLIFFPDKLPDDFKFQFPGNFREVFTTLKSGEKIHSLVFNSESTKGTILYFHGNAGSLEGWGNVGAELAQRTGWCVWIMDFPGYGKSTGKVPKTEKVLLEMGRALREQIENEMSGKPVILFGRSVGSGIASALAVEKAPKALILETPYRSIAKLGHDFYPFLPEAFSRFDLDNEKALPALATTPVLIVHGTRDSVIPYTHGKFLSELMPTAKFVTIEFGDHNDLADFKEYWPAISSFIQAL